ncbi:hypothetical protein RYX36_007383 [Vicia faba]
MVDRSFNGEDLFDMSLISKVIKLPDVLNEKFISCRRIHVKDFPAFNLARFPEIHLLLVKIVIIFVSTSPVIMMKKKFSKKSSLMILLDMKKNQILHLLRRSL